MTLDEELRKIAEKTTIKIWKNIWSAKSATYLSDEIESAMREAIKIALTMEPSEEMIEAARPILLYADFPGRTLEGLRAHLVGCGVDYLAWFPVWATRETGHLTKGSLAILIYRAMNEARLKELEKL